MNKFVKALEEKKENMAQLGLGHSYSRSKVKFNVNRSDNMVIQAIALIDQLDKARIRNFSMIFRPYYMVRKYDEHYDLWFWWKDVIR